MSKRKRRNRRSRKASIRIAVLILIIILSVSISTAFANAQGKFDAGLFTILFIVFVLGFGILFFVLSRPSIKGKMGERHVSKKLNRLANKYGGYVIDDVIIPGENDKTSQVDHIYVNNSGVYVIETKNYSGRIYGNDNQREWTQVLAYGKTKNKLYNPVMQNKTHIYRLQQTLDIKVNFISVVIFVKGNIDYINSESVFTFKELKRLIKNGNHHLNDDNVERIYFTLMDYKTNPVKTNKEHIKEIKQTQKDIKNNICPRCGGNLVLRKAKDSGSLFYACENYPRCTFIKKK